MQWSNGVALLAYCIGHLILYRMGPAIDDLHHPCLAVLSLQTVTGAYGFLTTAVLSLPTDQFLGMSRAYGRNRFSMSSNHTNEENQVSDLEKNAIIRHAWGLCFSGLTWRSSSWDPVFLLLPDW